MGFGKWRDPYTAPLQSKENHSLTFANEKLANKEASSMMHVSVPTTKRVLFDTSPVTIFHTQMKWLTPLFTSCLLTHVPTYAVPDVDGKYRYQSPLEAPVQVPK